MHDRLTRRTFCAAGALALGGCAASGRSARADPKAAIGELASTGKLRAAINLGNPILRRAAHRENCAACRWTW